MDRALYFSTKIYQKACFEQPGGPYNQSIHLHTPFSNVELLSWGPLTLFLQIQFQSTFLLEIS